MKLRERVLHDLKFEIAAGDESVVASSDIKIRGRYLRQVSLKLAHLGDVPRSGGRREIGQRVIVLVDTNERGVDRSCRVIVGEELLEPGVERVSITRCPCRRRIGAHRGRGRSVQRRSWCDISTALMISCTQAPSSKFPWLRGVSVISSSRKSLMRLA